MLYQLHVQVHGVAACGAVLRCAMSGFEAVTLDTSVLHLAHDITLFQAGFQCREPIHAGEAVPEAGQQCKETGEKCALGGIRTRFQGPVGSLLGQPLNCGQCGHVRVGRIATALK